MKLKQANVLSRFSAYSSLLILLLAMPGCASLSPSLSPGAAKIQEVEKTSVSTCKYLGEVIGTSKAGNVVYQVGKDRARYDALEKAAKLGGTHIVWFKALESYPIKAIGDVYLCP
jgi:hypothetical protein